MKQNKRTMGLDALLENQLGHWPKFQKLHKHFYYTGGGVPKLSLFCSMGNGQCIYQLIFKIFRLNKVISRIGACGLQQHSTSGTHWYTMHIPPYHYVQISAQYMYLMYQCIAADKLAGNALINFHWGRLHVHHSRRDHLAIIWFRFINIFTLLCTQIHNTVQAQFRKCTFRGFYPWILLQNTQLSDNPRYVQ